MAGLTVASHDIGRGPFRVLSVTFDDSYATGGEALTPAMAGLELIQFVIAEPASGYVFAYDYAAQKLKAYRAAGATPAGTVSAPTFTGAALAGHAHTVTDGSTSSDSAGTPAGTVSAPTFTGTAIGAAAFTEVSNAVDLSAVTARVLVVGR